MNQDQKFSQSINSRTFWLAHFKPQTKQARPMGQRTNLLACLIFFLKDRIEVQAAQFWKKSHSYTTPQAHMSQLRSKILTTFQFPHTSHNKQHKETLKIFHTSQPPSSEPLHLPLLTLNTAATSPFVVAARTPLSQLFLPLLKNTPLLGSSFHCYKTSCHYT